MKMNETEFHFFEWLYEKESPSYLDDETSKIYDDDYYYSIAYSYDLSEAYINLMGKLGEEKGRERMYDLIRLRYSQKWEEEYSLLITKYDPLQSYSHSEKENVGTKISTEVENDNDIYGFNSDSAVNSSDSKSKTTTSSDKVDNERVLERNGTDKAKSELLQNELFVRERWQFFQMIYKDISAVICSYYIR